MYSSTYVLYIPLKSFPRAQWWSAAEPWLILTASRPLEDFHLMLEESCEIWDMFLHQVCPTPSAGGSTSAISSTPEKRGQSPQILVSCTIPGELHNFWVDVQLLRVHNETSCPKNKSMFFISVTSFIPKLQRLKIWIAQKTYLQQRQCISTHVWRLKQNKNPLLGVITLLHQGCKLSSTPVPYWESYPVALTPTPKYSPQPSESTHVTHGRRRHQHAGIFLCLAH
jgi:hypothetical protein